MSLRPPIASEGTVLEGKRRAFRAPREITGIRSTRLYGMPFSSSIRRAAIAGCEPGIDVELRFRGLPVGRHAAILSANRPAAG